MPVPTHETSRHVSFVPEPNHSGDYAFTHRHKQILNDTDMDANARKNTLEIELLKQAHLFRKHKIMFAHPHT